jgi:hypothetical protein
MPAVPSDKIAQASQLLLASSVCAACIASRLAVTEDEVSLARIHDAIYVRISMDRCRACEGETVVYSLPRGA